MRLDDVRALFEPLGMGVAARVTDTMGRTHAYGSYYVGACGQHFYSSLEHAANHAKEIANIRQFTTFEAAS